MIDDFQSELGMIKLWPKIILPFDSVSKEGLEEAKIFLSILASGRDFFDWRWTLLDSTEAWSIGDEDEGGMPPSLCVLAETLAQAGWGVMPKVENGGPMRPRALIIRWY